MYIYIYIHIERERVQVTLAEDTESWGSSGECTSRTSLLTFLNICGTNCCRYKVCMPNRFAGRILTQLVCNIISCWFKEAVC